MGFMFLSQQNSMVSKKRVTMATHLKTVLQIVIYLYFIHFLENETNTFLLFYYYYYYF